jgi:hypothetical protein
MPSYQHFDGDGAFVLVLCRIEAGEQLFVHYGDSYALARDYTPVELDPETMNNVTDQETWSDVIHNFEQVVVAKRQPVPRTINEPRMSLHALNRPPDFAQLFVLSATSRWARNKIINAWIIKESGVSVRVEYADSVGTETEIQRNEFIRLEKKGDILRLHYRPPQLDDAMLTLRRELEEELRQAPAP